MVINVMSTGQKAEPMDLSQGTITRSQPDQSSAAVFAEYISDRPRDNEDVYVKASRRARVGARGYVSADVALELAPVDEE